MSWIIKDIIYPEAKQHLYSVADNNGQPHFYTVAQSAQTVGYYDYKIFDINDFTSYVSITGDNVQQRTVGCIKYNGYTNVMSDGYEYIHSDVHANFAINVRLSDFIPVTTSAGSFAKVQVKRENFLYAHNMDEWHNDAVWEIDNPIFPVHATLKPLYPYVVQYPYVVEGIGRYGNNTIDFDFPQGSFDNWPDQSIYIEGDLFGNFSLTAYYYPLGEPVEE